MTAYNRNGNKWTISETMRLHREYELLELDVFNISELHKRSPDAIRYQLVNAEIVDCLDSIRGTNFMVNVLPQLVKEEVANELSCYKLIKRKQQSRSRERYL